MLIRVLGPVEVETGGRWLPPGPPKQRAVLATLALAAGRSVSSQALADVLWADRPPPSATHNIQLYVWRLRRLFGERLRSRPHGYQLDVEPGELDADRFTGYVRWARAARAAGDLDEAAACLIAALGEWQGSALQDLVAGGMAVRLAQALEDERLRAMLDLVDIELALGHGAQLVPRLAAWTQAYPYDEDLRERQVRVLLALDRPAEALAAYGEAESSLQVELRQRPGPALQQVAGAARRALATAGPLRLLPPTTSTFVGRRAEIAQLASWLAPRMISVPVVEISGPGGIGKSALALRVAHQLAKSFPDGQLYLDLQGAGLDIAPLRPRDAVRSLLVALGTPAEEMPADAGDAATLLRARFAHRGVLLVLDNVADAAQVRPLLPPGAGCAVLITARQPLADLDGLTQLPLGTLPATDARELVTALIGADRLAAEGTDGLADLIEACGGLPLALRLAGARLASRPSWSVRTFGARLSDERHRLDELRVGDVAVRSTFAASYRHLSDATQHVFRCCGLFPGPDFAAEPIAVLAEMGVDEVTGHLESLVDAALLQTDRPARYRPHDLIRIYAAERAAEQDSADHPAALHRLARWYLAAAESADRLLDPARGRPSEPPPGLEAVPLALADRSQALAWLGSERSTLVALVRLSADHGHHDIAAQLPSVLKGFFELERHTDAWISSHEIGLRSARHLGDQIRQARLLNGLGSGFWRTERYGAAIDCYREALDLVRRLGDRVKEAVMLNNLGSVYGEHGDSDTAIDLLRAALAIRQEVGRGLDESFALHNLGHVYHEGGRFAEALPLLEQALTLRRQLGNRRGEGATLHCLGDTMLGLGRHHDADAALDQALSIFDAVGDRYGRATAMHSIGRLRYAQRRPEEAVLHLHQAAARYSELGCRRDNARALADLRIVETAGAPDAA